MQNLYRPVEAKFSLVMPKRDPKSTADLEEDNTINSFGKLIVDSHATTNPIPYSNLDTSPLQTCSGANSAYIEASKKKEQK
ncbi:hypothetical protein Bhyg_03226 [Pseudolycoriella hygida]|uniref:Uncharacterized protein n=1 Tax=Pseudolycoriella hygida TaxID=35572 RepID=A0A9Q0NEG8_9DIPT|nr:hypothetical protein Bhyg_03226 [Pseudolycoriella hygida]